MASRREAALEDWSLVLASPRSPTTSQAAHTSQSPLFGTWEPQAQGSPGEDGFPARKAGTGFKELAAGEKRRLVLTGRHPFFALQLPSPASVGQIHFVQLRQEGRDKLMRHPHCPAEPQEAFRCLLRKCHQSRDIKQRM